MREMVDDGMLPLPSFPLQLPLIARPFSLSLPHYYPLPPCS